MMRYVAPFLISCVLFSAAAPAAPLAQARPQESAADAAARKAREAEAAKQEAEQEAAKRLAESKRKRQAAREEAQNKQGDAPVQSDKPARPRPGDAPAKPRRDAPSDAPSDRIGGQSPDRDRASDRPGDAAPEPTANAELRRLRREALALERRHRERSARINRLAVVFREQGETEKVQQLELMAERENLRYERALERYRREMGPEAFAKLEQVLEAGRGRPGKAPGAQSGGDRPGDRAPAQSGGRTDEAEQNEDRTDRPRGDKPSSDRPQGGDKPLPGKAPRGGRGSV